MKIALAAAAAFLLALAGCAGVRTSLDTQPTAAGAAGTYYCWKDRLVDAGSNLVCNWERSAADACRSDAVVSLVKSGVVGTPQGSRRCDNGQWLVTVTAR